MAGKNLQFFIDQVDQQVDEAVTKWDDNNESFKVGWLKSALAMELWKNQVKG